MKRLTLVPTSLLQRWLVPPRLFLVPAALVALFLTLYFGPELGLEALRRWLHAPELRYGPWQDLREFQGKVVLIACALYGLVRLLPFHPMTRPGYKPWLQQTPWTVRQPLPLGPAHLVLRDALAIAGLTVCGFRAGVHWALPAALVGTVYLVVLAFTLVGGHVPKHATVLAFGPPLFAILSSQPAWMLAAVGAFYCVGYVGLRKSLSKFPWRDPDEVHPSLRPPKAQSLGWPLKWVAPIPPDKPVPASIGFLIALLVAWWVFGLMVLTGEPVGPETHADPLEILRLMALGACCGLFAGVIRAVGYLVGTAPPLGTLGRLRTGRLVIPEYDHVLVAPALVWLLATVTPGAVFYFLHVGSAANAAISVFVVLSAAINLGPTMASWRLTGAGSHPAPVVVGRERQPKAVGQEA
jgi:hypothetical protein